MIFLELAMALGTIAPPGPAPEKIEDECVRVHKIPPAVKPKPRPVLVGQPVKKKRLYRADPKPAVEEPECEAPRLEPPLTVVEPEPEGEFTPIPYASIITIDVPVPDMPPVEEAPPCGCFAPAGPGFAFVPVYARPIPGLVVPPVQAIPEPSTYALLFAGAVMLGMRKRATTASGKQSNGTAG